MKEERMKMITLKNRNLIKGNKDLKTELNVKTVLRHLPEILHSIDTIDSSILVSTNHLIVMNAAKNSPDLNIFGITRVSQNAHTVLWNLEQKKSA